MKNDPTMNVTFEPPIDLESLTSRCLGKVDLVMRVLQRFEKTVDEELAELCEAVEPIDRDRLARSAHRMRGTALTVSAAPLVDRIKRLESALEHPELIELQTCIDGIRQACADVHRIVNEVQGRR